MLNPDNEEGDPVTLPTKLPWKVPACTASLPKDHLSMLSSQTKVLFVWVPLSTSMPALSLGLDPVKSAFKVIMLSPIFKVVVFI